MTITIEIEGIDQLKRDLAKLGKEAEKGVSDAVTATALEINTNVKKAIQRGPKTGRIYTRGGGQNLSREHQASAPGQAPATDTGTLVSSVYFEQSGKMSATIGSRLAYAYYLEYGTSRMASRPVWVPETEKGQKALNRRVDAAMERATR